MTDPDLSRTLRRMAEEHYTSQFGDGTLTLAELKRRRPDLEAAHDEDVASLEQFAHAVAAAVRQEQAERDAQIADQWANSQSCGHHTDNPCCHVRTGASIAEAIRSALLRDGGRR